MLSTGEISAAERAALGTQGPLAALCLSGGGIRSAAFCLGALQALAAGRLLPHFHYLSTVSGGGYVGGWLTRCIAQHHEDQPGADPVTFVAEQVLRRTTEQEHPALRQLRRYTDFLTPDTGLASLDPWAGVTLWLRNTVVNCAVFLPLMLAAATAPVLYLALADAIAAAPAGAWIVPGAAGLGCLGVAVFNSCIWLPSRLQPSLAPGAPFGLGQRQTWRRIIVWALAWMALAPLALVPGPGAAAPALLSAGVWLTCLAAYLLAWATAATPTPAADGSRPPDTFLVNLPGWVASSAVSALLLWLGGWLAGGADRLWVAIVGPIWVLLAELLRSTAYVAVRIDAVRTDLDREWLARLNASKLRAVLVFAAVAAAALLLPRRVLDQPSAAWGSVVAAAGFLGGPLAARIGSSARTAFAEPATAPSWLPLNAIVAAGTTVFAAALCMLLGRLGGWLASAPALLLQARGSLPPGDAFGVFATTAATALLLIGACAALAFVLDRAINLNRFSMHAVYRNRLVRAFLGTARPQTQRHPDAFTGFDPRDNIRVADTFDGRPTRALFPVINVTLNTTWGNDMARAERNGEPFTITPLHCGAAALRGGTGAYVATCDFAGADRETGPGDRERGITLGTAITLSGAAVSPNRGYQSSPFTAFLMTLFNVRLGAWLPNPGAVPPLPAAMLQGSGPRQAIPTLLAELIGRSTDRGQYVYLSDGGHFDNLGLYEMLRRRCAHIVVIDAGRDEGYAYADLGRALQHALIDMNVRVDFMQPLRVGDPALTQHGAFAAITYAAGDGLPESSGALVYLKPWLPDEAPTELHAFKALNASFPHDSTLDQFFTESDFESYRRLGEYLAAQMLQEAGGDTLAAVFAGIRQTMAPPELD